VSKRLLKQPPYVKEAPQRAPSNSPLMSKRSLKQSPCVTETPQKAPLCSRGIPSPLFQNAAVGRTARKGQIGHADIEVGVLKQQQPQDKTGRPENPKQLQCERGGGRKHLVAAMQGRKATKMEDGKTGYKQQQVKCKTGITHNASNMQSACSTKCSTAACKQRQQSRRNTGIIHRGIP
jgi:hypothetical protein